MTLMKFCAICGRIFVQTKPWHKFCSDICRAKNWTRNNREKKREINNAWNKRNRSCTTQAYIKYAQKHPLKIKARNLITNNLNKYPLDDKCVFCGETDKLEHGHIDYSYPDLYLTVCHLCNIWMDK